MYKSFRLGPKDEKIVLGRPETFLPPKRTISARENGFRVRKVSKTQKKALKQIHEIGETELFVKQTLNK